MPWASGNVNSSVASAGSDKPRPGAAVPWSGWNGAMGSARSFLYRQRRVAMGRSGSSLLSRAAARAVSVDGEPGLTAETRANVARRLIGGNRTGDVSLGSMGHGGRQHGLGRAAF